MFQRGYRRGSQVFRPAKVVVNDLTPGRPGPLGH
jgi:methenyltetrahydromethanopterin cyclohydrolase